MTHNEDSIILVRHGEAAASWGQSADPGLSALGVQQAAATAELLRSSFGSAEQAGTQAAPANLVSSPMLRAQETAAPLARHWACEVRIDERFREIPSPVPLSERQDWLRGFMREHWSAQPEQLLAWRQGILTALRELPANSIVFSHFLVINSIVGHCEGSDQTLVCWPDNASVTRLLRSDQGLRVGELGTQMKTRVN